MKMQTWIDGFNLFHRWERTARFFQRGGDIIRGQDLGLRFLSEGLGNRRTDCTVFMDGGLDRRGMQAHGLRVEYAGPGKKADQQMLEAMHYRSVAGGRVEVVTSDRELAGGLRAFGAMIVPVDRFLERLKPASSRASGGTSGKTGAKGKSGRLAQKADNAPSRDANLTPRQVDDWLRYFEDGE